MSENSRFDHIPIIGYLNSGKPIYEVRGASEYAVEPATQGNPADNASQESTGGNQPPWASYLNDLPETVRPLVEPKFREWDASTTQKFQQIHSQYESVKPYQEFVESGYDFNDVQQAIQFANLVNEDPERVYNALAQQYGYGTEQGLVGAETEYAGGEDFAPQVNPEFEQYKQMTEQMAQIMTAQHNQQVEMQEDQALNNQLASLKNQHGEFDDEYVLAKVYAGASWDDAIQSYANLAGQFRQQSNAPVVMGSGGGLPSQQVAPSQMSDRERKNLVAQFIAQQNQT